MRLRIHLILSFVLLFCSVAPLLAKPKVQRIHLRSRVQIQYVVDGPRNAPPIIFLHGYTDSSHSWSAVTPHLAGDYRTYALDQRGHGESEKPQYGGYSMTHYADDVIAFMDKRSIDKAVLVGHSMGSLIAHRVAALHPQRVSHLVLIGSATGGTNNEVLEFVWNEIVGLPSFEDPVDPDFIRDWQTGPNPVDPVFFEKVLEETAKVPARVWKDALLGLLTDDHSAFLNKIVAPTLIVWGTQDGIFFEADQDALRAALPDAVFTPYDGAGHNTHWEEPQRFADDLRAWIEGNP